MLQRLPEPSRLSEARTSVPGPELFQPRRTSPERELDAAFSQQLRQHQISWNGTRERWNQLLQEATPAQVRAWMTGGVSALQGQPIAIQETQDWRDKGAGLHLSLGDTHTKAPCFIDVFLRPGKHADLNSLYTKKAGSGSGRQCVQGLAKLCRHVKVPEIGFFATQDGRAVFAAWGGVAESVEEWNRHRASLAQRWKEMTADKYVGTESSETQKQVRGALDSEDPRALCRLAVLPEGLRRDLLTGAGEWTGTLDVDDHRQMEMLFGARKD